MDALAEELEAEAADVDADAADADALDALDAARWRMLPALLEDHQIDSMKLHRDIDAAMAAQAAQKGGGES